MPSVTQLASRWIHPVCESTNCFSFSLWSPLNRRCLITHFLFPHFKALCVFKWWHTSVSYPHTCSPQHTCKPRPLGLLWLAAERGSVISCVVITELSSHETGLGESSHAALHSFQTRSEQEFCLFHSGTNTLFSPPFFLTCVFWLSPFSDCHQVLRRLWAKVVTTFSMVWLTGLLSSSYICLESHMKHFFSSCWTESVKGPVHPNSKKTLRFLPPPKHDCLVSPWNSFHSDSVCKK